MEHVGRWPPRARGRWETAVSRPRPRRRAPCRRQVSLLAARQLVEDVAEIGGKLAGEFHPALVRWMSEDKACGMEKRTLQMRHRAQIAWDVAMDAAVECIADNRVADCAQVHADLMCAAG